MIQIPFDNYEFRTKAEGGKHHIFDVVRKKYVVLTPEEWVRQHWVHYFIENRGYPNSLIRVEMGLKVNELQKRCDIVVFNRSGRASLIVECKNPDVNISQSTFDQIAAYNLSLRVQFLVVSNGKQTYCCKLDFEAKSYAYLESIPDFANLNMDAR